MNFILIGNPDCGKSTLFNAVCKGQRKTGSFPGISVDVGIGTFLHNGRRHTLADLPGTYSYSFLSAEEQTAIEYITDTENREKCDCIICIVDAVSIQRGIMLVLEIMKKERNMPIVVGLSRADRLKEKKMSIDSSLLSERLGVSVIPFCASKANDRGTIELINEAVKANKRGIFKYENQSADKLLEKAIIFPSEYCQSFSTSVDRVLTNKWIALPFFLIVMFLIFLLTFVVIAPPLERWVSFICSHIGVGLKKALSLCGASIFLQDFIIDGIWQGIAGVLGYLPIIITLFALLSIPEECGYLARVAFIFDLPMRYVHMSGKSVVPLILGFGCTIPGIMSTRIIPSENERKLCIFTVPFMSCPAKIPVYLIITHAFFTGYSWLIIFCLYFSGVVSGLLYAMVFGKALTRSERSAFIMELPDYKLPKLKTVLHHALKRTVDFLGKAVTVVPLVSALLYLASILGPNLKPSVTADASILAYIGGLISPLMRPLGLSDYRICTSLLSGFGAKEAVAGSLCVLFGVSAEGISQAISQTITPCAAVAFLLFFALCPPCIGAFSAMRRECGSLRLAARAYIIQLLLAFGIGSLAHLISKLVLAL